MPTFEILFGVYCPELTGEELLFSRACETKVRAADAGQMTRAEAKEVAPQVFKNALADYLLRHNEEAA
jgi:hypothetical protein